MEGVAGFSQIPRHDLQSLEYELEYLGLSDPEEPTTGCAFQPDEQETQDESHMKTSPDTSHKISRTSSAKVTQLKIRLLNRKSLQIRVAQQEVVKDQETKRKLLQKEKRATIRKTET